MQMFIKSWLAACAVALAVTMVGQSPAAAAPEPVPEACSHGTFMRNGQFYGNQCVIWGTAYNRHRCLRWMPVPCGGGGTSRR